MRACREDGGEAEGRAILWGAGLRRGHLEKRCRRHVSQSRRPRALAKAQSGRRSGMGQQVGRVGEPGTAALQQPPAPQPPPPLPQPQARGLRGNSSSSGGGGGARPGGRRREVAGPRGAESGFNVFAQHGKVGSEWRAVSRERLLGGCGLRQRLEASGCGTRTAGEGGLPSHPWRRH